MGMRRVLLAVVAGLAVIGLLAPPAGPPGGGHEQAARAVAGLDGAEPLAALPADFAAVAGYRPDEVALPAGGARAVNPAGGCSVVWGGRPWGFDDLCRAHDLGYDVLRYAASRGAPLPPDARAAVDGVFADDLHRHCDAVGGGRPCHAQADLYAAVIAFNTWRQRAGVPVAEPLPAWTAGLGLTALLATPRRARLRARTAPSPDGAPERGGRGRDGDLPGRRAHQAGGPGPVSEAGARDRYVDLLRVLAVGVVVLGHWLGAVVTVEGGAPRAGHVLLIAPQLQAITLVLQVMPLFFLVGGYANAASLRAATGARTWLRGRYRRLLVPTAALVGAWAALGGLLVAAGLDAGLVTTGARHALGPLWFLAVYLGVVAVAPVLLRLHDRHGLSVVTALGALAVATDALATVAPAVGWANLAWVWLALHQLGIAWQAGTLRRPGALLAGGAAAVALLVATGVAPVNMLDHANTAPPSAALLALGVAHTGAVLLLRAPAARLLARPRVARAVVRANREVMALYLWHVTALMLAVLVLVLPGVWPAAAPLSPDWWALRPLWLAVLALASAPLVALGGVARPRWRKPPGV